MAVTIHRLPRRRGRLVAHGQPRRAEEADRAVIT